MNTSSSPAATVYAVSTLEDTPRRALELLRGVGSSPSILRLMTQAGYTASAHEEGQRLLANVVSFVQGRQAFSTATSAAHAAAVAEIETWEKTVFRRLRAGVIRFFPNETEALFANLKVSSEMDASLLVKVFLDRISASPESKGRKGNAAVLKLFAQRGFGGDEIRHLKKLVSIAMAPAPDAVEETDSAELTAQKTARVEMLTELRGWYDDWAETARSVLTRRDHQIRVGLAHRKLRAPVAAVPPTLPAPAAPAPAMNDIPTIKAA